VEPTATTTPATKPWRVVQWATGNIGSRALREIIDHPHLELAGLYVYSEEKAGQDAGALVGRPETGVIATRDIEEILATGADCVLYMPNQVNADELCRLLAAGLNVVTTRGEFHHPGTLDPALREPIEKACAAGNTSLHSTGSSPGFITEAVPLVLTSISRRLERLTIEEFADLSSRDSPDMLFNLMGFGADPADFDPIRFTYLAHAFGPTLRTLADGLGLPLDAVEATGQVALVSSDTEIAAGTLRKGTVGGQRVTVSGLRNGEPLLRFRPTWFATRNLDLPEADEPWDLGQNGWHISVEGDTPLDVQIRFAVPMEQMAESSPGYTANRAVNAVGVLCAAEPGIRTTHELPQIIATMF
jgi:hypothetical protein